MTKTYTEEEMRELMNRTILLDRQVAFMRWAINVAAQAKIPEEIYSAGVGLFQAMTTPPAKAEPEEQQEE